MIQKNLIHDNSNQYQLYKLCKYLTKLNHFPIEFTKFIEKFCK